MIVEEDEVYNDLGTTSYCTPANLKSKSLSVHEMEELRMMRVEKRFSQF